MKFNLPKVISEIKTDDEAKKIIARFDERSFIA
jgi:hypothetical protein